MHPFFLGIGPEGAPGLWLVCDGHDLESVGEVPEAADAPGFLGVIMEEVEFASQDGLHESISETNQNFSKVARMVDENGAAVIRKNNAPRYVLIDYGKLQTYVEADNETKG